MKHCFFLLAFIWFFSACQKKKSTTTAAPATKTDSAQHADSVKQISPYPYEETYIGQYTEYNPDAPPYNYSGTSTVTITYVDGSNIIIKSPAIGISHSFGDYSDNVNISTRVNDSNTYIFEVQWCSDRWDTYKMTLMKGSLVCAIDQTMGQCAFDDYTGTFTGYIKH